MSDLGIAPLRESECPEFNSAFCSKPRRAITFSVCRYYFFTLFFLSFRLINFINAIDQERRVVDRDASWENNASFFVLFLVQTRVFLWNWFRLERSCHFLFEKWDTYHMVVRQHQNKNQFFYLILFVGTIKLH